MSTENSLFYSMKITIDSDIVRPNAFLISKYVSPSCDYSKMSCCIYVPPCTISNLAKNWCFFLPSFISRCTGSVSLSFIDLDHVVLEENVSCSPFPTDRTQFKDAHTWQKSRQGNASESDPAGTYLKWDLSLHQQANQPTWHFNMPTIGTTRCHPPVTSKGKYNSSWGRGNEIFLQDSNFVLKANAGGVEMR